MRGKHHEQYRAGTNVVLLDADVARVFRDSESVNRALRLLLDLAKNQLPPGYTPGTASGGSPPSANPQHGSKSSGH